MLQVWFFFFGFLQDHYVFIVSQFMYIPWNYTRKQAAIRASVQNGDSCTPSINIGAAEAFESEITEYIKEQVWQWQHKELKWHGFLIWIINEFLHYVFYSTD